MGVLVGTSLIVIIPEGIETLYSASAVGHTHSKRALGLDHDRNIHWTRLDSQNPVGSDPSSQDIWSKLSAAEEYQAIDALPGLVSINCKDSADCRTIRQRSPADPNARSDEKMDHKSSGDDKAMPGLGPTTPDDHHVSSSAHVWVGISLTLGFVLMYLIDSLPRHAASSRPQPEPYHISLDNLSQGLQRPQTPSSEPDTQGFLRSRSRKSQSRSTATTTGLVIHAAADGIALGASSSTPNAGLGFIVFLAIMIHKAPAAFGLTSVLLKQGLSKRSARAHLLVFSLAAPAGALTTWAIAQVLMGGAVGDENTTKWWTGILLLFSAGTFL
jgi:zinc transporter 9